MGGGAGITPAGNQALADTLIAVLRSNQIAPEDAQTALSITMDKWREEWGRINSYVGLGHHLSGMIAAEKEVVGHDPHVSDLEAKMMQVARTYADRRTEQMEAAMERYRLSWADGNHLTLTPPITRGSRLTEAEAWIINKASETLVSLTETGWPVMQAGGEPTDKQIDWLSRNWGQSARVWALAHQPRPTTGDSDDRSDKR